jgi:non-ribosomal peptide synthase protein (TIGR01720 family)
VKDEAAYWLTEERRHVGVLPVDWSDGANLLADQRTMRVQLSLEDTATLLREVPAVYHTHINEALLAALAQTLYWWSGDPRWVISMEGHGREEISAGVDVTQTVGWFAILYPVLLDLSELVQAAVSGGKTDRANSAAKKSAVSGALICDPGAVLLQVKKQMRTVPQGGLGYGLLRYLTTDDNLREALRAMPQAQINFNYLGQLDLVLSEKTVLQPAREPFGSQHSPDEPRPHLLEIVSMVTEGQLQVMWDYSCRVHRAETIEKIANHYLKELQRVIARCREVRGLPDSTRAEGITPIGIY